MPMVMTQKVLDQHHLQCSATMVSVKVHRNMTCYVRQFPGLEMRHWAQRQDKG